MALRRVSVASLLTVLTVSGLFGCGGPGPVRPQDDFVVEGKVRLPQGSPLDPQELRVLGANGSSDLAADGSFAVEVNEDGLNLLAVVGQDGRLVLLGFLGTREAEAELSGRSTAAALLYMALGGQFQEAWLQERMFEALGVEPEVAALDAELSGILAADPGALADGNDALVNAVMAARERLAARGRSGAGAFVTAQTSDADPTGMGGSGRSFPADLLAAAATDKNYVVITDPHEEAGMETLLADSGTGVYLKNSKRRPARLFAYETGVKVGDGPVVQVGPVPVGSYLSVPPSNSLEFGATLGAIASGDFMSTPLAPAYSEPAELPLENGTTRTYYTVIALAPSLSAELPAVFTDSRFFGFRSEWDRQLLELDFEVFWSNLILPVMANVGLGLAVTKVNYQAVRSTALNVMGVAAPILTPIGIGNPMGAERARALAALIEKAALDESADVYWALVENARNALGAAARPGSVDPRAFARAVGSAGGILKIVALVLTGADVVAVVSDMAGNPPGAAWEVIRTEVSAKLTPSEGQVGKYAPSTDFKVVIDAPLDGGSYVYRWSTSGEYGYLYDYLGQEGQSLETTRSQVLYVANAPNAITDDLRDTIAVEVYKDDGSGKVAPGAALVAQATATVIGKEKQDLFAGRWFYHTASYADGAGNPRVCQVIYLGIKLVPGATTYEATGTGFYDPYYYGSTLAVGYRTGQTVPPPTDDNPCPYERLQDGEYQKLLTGGWGPAGSEDPGLFNGRFQGMVVEVVVTY